MDYITSRHLSYSRIKSLLHQGEKSDSVSLQTGSIVDSILTGNPNEEIEVVELKSLAPQEDKFIRELYKLTDKPDALDFQVAFNNVGIKRGKVDDFIKVFNDNQDFWKFLKHKDLSDKIVTTKKHFENCEIIADRVINSDYGWYFNHHYQVDGSIKFQLELYYEYGNYGYKIKPDILLVDSTNKTIRCIDLKTTSSHPANFLESYVAYGYNFQSRFYNYVLSLLYPDYTILPFQFLVVSTVKDHDVLLFTDDLDMTETNAKLDIAINMYERCVDNGVFPSRENYLVSLYGTNIPLSAC